MDYSGADSPYRLKISGPAVRALTKTLPEKVAAAVYEFVTGPLLRNPRQVGKPLEPPLAPIFSARRGTYRVLYLIDEERRIVEFTAVRLSRAPARPPRRCSPAGPPPGPPVGPGRR